MKDSETQVSELGHLSPTTEWKRLASLPDLRPVVDPNDRDGIKNEIIDRIHWQLIRRALPKAGTVLDLGCGIGRFAKRIERLGLRYVGVDPEPQMLAAARQLNSGSEAVFVEASATELPFANGVFDACLMCWVFQYISNTPVAEPTMREIRRVLSSGGRLLLLEQASMKGTQSSTVQRSSSENDYVRQVNNFFSIQEVRTVRLAGLTFVSNALLRFLQRTPWLLQVLLPLGVLVETTRARCASVRQLRRNAYYDILLIASSLHGLVR